MSEHTPPTRADAAPPRQAQWLELARQLDSMGYTVIGTARKPEAAAEQFWALVKGPVLFPLLLGFAEPAAPAGRKKMAKQAVDVFLSYYGK